MKPDNKLFLFPCFTFIDTIIETVPTLSSITTT